MVKFYKNNYKKHCKYWNEKIVTVHTGRILQNLSQHML